MHEITYKKVISLFESFKVKTEENTIKKEKKYLIPIEKSSDLETHCLNKRRACFVALLDGRLMNNEYFEKSVALLNELNEESQEKPYSFLYLNATCHTEFLEEFSVNIDSLPNALVFVPIKDMYTSMIGTFDKESIQSFLERVIHGKVSMQSTTKDRVKIQDKDCSLIVEEQIIEEEDDDIMKEMMEEIKRKEQEEEEKRKKEEEDKANKKKKKKKKKKTDL